MRSKVARVVGVALAFAQALASAPLAAAPAGVTRYAGPCDASAAVPLSAETFIVANDETNTLYIYKRGVPQPIDSIPVTKFLGMKARDEADIEGAATIGQRVYWITSHARDSKGKSRPGRRRFFATDIGDDPKAPLATFGKPYVNLQHDMLEAPQLARYRLSDAEQLPPEAPGGFNIEGLAATPAGGLLIGLRNPLFEGHALLIPLDNPVAVVGGDRAQFGTAFEFDLGGRGIRSIERVGTGYLIVAGPFADRGTFALYRWSGSHDEAPKALNVDLGTLRPEALIAIPNTAQVQLFSDDGGIETDGVACKDLEFAKQSFRSLIFTPP